MYMYICAWSYDLNMYNEPFFKDQVYFCHTLWPYGSPMEVFSFNPATVFQAFACVQFRCSTGQGPASRMGRMTGWFIRERFFF